MIFKVTKDVQFRSQGLIYCDQKHLGVGDDDDGDGDDGDDENRKEAAEVSILNPSQL